MKKVKNSQRFSNNQGGVSIKAGGNVVNGIYNHQEIVDNSWYPISKKETFLLEAVSKWVVEHVGKNGGFIGGAVSFVVGAVVTVKSFLGYLANFKPPVVNMVNGAVKFGTGSSSETFQSQISDPNFLIGWSGFVFFMIGLVILSSLIHRSESQCSKCKRHYAMEEMDDSKEKETKTGRGWVVSRIRNYKCKYCNHKEEFKTSFVRGED